MTPRVLVLVTADPEASHRAGEAIRIALGLAASEVSVRVVLLGPATKVLAAGVEDYVDGEAIARHVAALVRLGHAFWVAAGVGVGIGQEPPAGATVVPVTADDLAKLVAEAERTLVF